MSKQYRKDLDVLKGLAIIAVVLYHMGILSSGYLGVDLFFVINGFLVIPSVIRAIENGEFSYIKFLKKRVIRLLPLIVIANIVCLAVGYWGMLPDDYENLSQYVAASGVLSGNIISSISSANYWDVLNDYKPLMHMWYIGILFEFYVLFPIVVCLFKKIIKLANWKYEKAMNLFMVFLCVISFLLYLNPNVSAAHKFYFLQYRLFEVVVGGIIALNINKLKIRWGGWFCAISLLLLIVIVYSGVFTVDFNHLGNAESIIADVPCSLSPAIMPGWVMLLLTVSLLCLVLVNDNQGSKFCNTVLNLNTLAIVGKWSFSLFVWHQVFLSFWRYFMSADISLLFLLGFLLVLGVVSFLSYRYIEQKISLSNISFYTTLGLDIVVVGLALYVYMIAGVVRDVPELDVLVSDRHRNMHAEYCDRVNAYNVDFPDENGKINVLVIGTSFGRDMANVLLESEYKDSINLSYADFDEIQASRVKESDVIFIFKSKEGVPAVVNENIKSSAKLYGIGTKNFGKTNGRFYIKRNTQDYFNQRVRVSDAYLAANEMLHDSWGEDYVDFMDELLVGKTLPVFTPDHKFISPDNKHLSSAGARYYSQVIDLKRFLYKNR